jgi:tyrosinase
MAADGVVADPTYMADIRFFFRQMDIDHMAAKGIDLSTYAGVKQNAVAIYFHTHPPNPDMPPDAAGQWSADQSQTFKNWISNGYPLGTATPPVTPPTPPPTEPALRVRKDVTTLGDDEIAALKSAFEGLMSRNPEAPDSYYVIAGVHGLPGAYCLHHEDRFNPWHRVYMKVFEDALRSVPGCEDVTMPYWDFETPLPALLQQAPFASYTLPKNPPGVSPVPYVTKRNDPATITHNMQQYGVFDDVTTSLRQSMWGAYNTSGYQDFSIQAHDGGHNAIGPTMADQDVASYDPVFWFFHCNIDRLWLSWQQNVGATTLQGFKSTLTGDTSWLTSPPFNSLPPYETTADQTIAFGIGYDKLASVDAEAGALENKLGSVEAGRRFSIKRSSPVSVRVKDIDRLNIPGSFIVNLLADGEPIAKRAFFQPKSPRDCATCAKLALVNIDFRMDQEQLLDRTLSVEIEVPGHQEIGTRFPLAQAGNPTINARLLIDDE